VLGWTPKELRSRPLIDFVHSDDRARASREIELMFAGLSDGCTNRLATRAGGWRDVEWTARVVSDDERVYAVARDVTERNGIEAALAASEARYRTLVHNLPNSSVVTFDHDLRFTFAAGDALATAGLSPDVVGRTLAEVLPQHAATLTPRYRAVLGGHTQAFEFSGTTRDRPLGGPQGAGADRGARGRRPAADGQPVRPHADRRAPAGRSRGGHRPHRRRPRLPGVRGHRDRRRRQHPPRARVRRAAPSTTSSTCRSTT
jgi:PAS domain-containing protein